MNRLLSDDCKWDNAAQSTPDDILPALILEAPRSSLTPLVVSTFPPDPRPELSIAHLGIAREHQNRAPKDRRAWLQWRSQQTVEGLSILIVAVFMGGLVQRVPKKHPAESH